MKNTLLKVRVVLAGAWVLMIAGGHPPNALAQSDPQNTVSELSVTSESLKVTPQTIVQGQQFYVDFQSPLASSDFRVEVMGQKFSLSADNGSYIAYIAIPADQKAGGYTLRILNAQGTEMMRQKIEVKQGRFSTQNIRYRRPPVNAALKKKLDVEYALIDVARNSFTPERFWVNSFKLPVPHRITSVYGTRRRLNGKYNGYHGGVDFASPMGYPIKAPAAGKVALARYFSAANANGNTVFVDHGLGVTSGYIHLSKILVKKGQRVKQGQTLGYIGSTGRSTGPHLHWGLYLNGQNTDGLGWIKFLR